MVVESSFLSSSSCGVSCCQCALSLFIVEDLLIKLDSFRAGRDGASSVCGSLCLCCAVSLEAKQSARILDAPSTLWRSVMLNKGWSGLYVCHGFSAGPRFDASVSAMDTSDFHSLLHSRHKDFERFRI